MFSDEVRALLRAMPFVPFTVHLSGDVSYDIPHSDFAMLTPSGASLYVALEKAPVQRINVDQIVRISSASDAGIAR